MSSPYGAVVDAHFHVIDPRYPLVPNQGYLPPAFTASDYRSRVRELGVVGGAVVSGSFQAFDQGYLVAALAELGPGFAGVTNLPATVSEETVLALDAAGVRAVRINLYRGGSAGPADLDRLARMVHEVAGWHTELYVDAGDLADLAPRLRSLPQVTIDHLAMSDDTTGTLLDLVAGGAVVKATGFGRIAVSDPEALMAAVVRTSPAGLVFGTDLPSTRARVPFRDEDVARVAEAVATVDPGLVPAVLRENAVRLYRLGDLGAAPPAAG
ncbi:2-pyrone-4,6-dicarboxylate hydrolase [Nakamurella flava]|uniref:2-pyrone-4,6-dicarboxylate hydrolase n=1 Tax=Nakamurella flava TaxID=2576308 RepID=A0A4U6Q969_9ACTN|nr:amidohydrolase family protein [Nakamurella flava]TKV56418.1 2-pyrone-4,6-dicarboxylate hydrolase [Nakamurella flava]